MHLLVPGVEAGLPEQRGLLVAGDAGDRQVEAEERRRVGAADDAVRRHDLGQRRRAARRTASHSSLDQRAGADVVQQRARGVGRVGDVAQARGQPGDEVGVDRADRDAAAR